jgi:speckle-type POZ protein
VTGHHLLHINCYSRTKEELPTGKSIKSCPFSAGGSSWHISYYPNGNGSEAADFVSVFIHLDQSIAESVKARVWFSLLDQAGEPVPSQSYTTQIYDFHKAATAYGYPQFINRVWLEGSKYLKDDRFTIRCDVIVNKELRAEETRPQFPLVVVPPSNLHQNFGDLLASKEGADVTFQVGGETFKAHKCVLAARSVVFKAEVFGAMRESTDGAVIHIDDMDAQVFRALLGFLYTDTIPDGFIVKEKEGAAMAQHLLVAADRYDLERLKLICEEKLCSHIDTDSAATILTLAEQHHCHGLKQACFRFLSSPSTLNAAMATDGFDHLTRSCPSVLKELMSEVKCCCSCAY